MKHDRPSSTANIVARNIAIVSADAETSVFVSSEAARLTALLIKTFSPSGGLFLKNASRKWFRKLFEVYASVTIPGLALHQALRKLYIERAVRECLALDFGQVVILGGGLDTLALRLHREFPDINFFELDHPTTQKVKRRAVENYDLKGENLYLLAADLTDQSVSEILKASTFDPAIKTVVVCEGVMMYLETEEVDRLFDWIRNQSRGVKRFIFTFMELDKRGDMNFRDSTFLVRLWLKMKNEPFKWGLGRNKIETFLVERQFALLALATPKIFREIYLTESQLKNHKTAEGENVCVCETSDLKL